MIGWAVFFVIDSVPATVRTPMNAKHISQCNLGNLLCSNTKYLAPSTVPQWNISTLSDQFNKVYIPHPFSSLILIHNFNYSCISVFILSPRWYITCLQHVKDLFCSAKFPENVLFPRICFSLIFDNRKEQMPNAKKIIVSLWWWWKL